MFMYVELHLLSNPWKLPNSLYLLWLPCWCLSRCSISFLNTSDLGVDIKNPSLDNNELAIHIKLKKGQLVSYFGNGRITHFGEIMEWGSYIQGECEAISNIVDKFRHQNFGMTATRSNSVGICKVIIGIMIFITRLHRIPIRLSGQRSRGLRVWSCCCPQQMRVDDRTSSLARCGIARWWCARGRNQARGEYFWNINARFFLHSCIFQGRWVSLCTNTNPIWHPDTFTFARYGEGISSWWPRSAHGGQQMLSPANRKKETLKFLISKTSQINKLIQII